MPECAASYLVLQELRHQKLQETRICFLLRLEKLKPIPVFWRPKGSGQLCLWGYLGVSKETCTHTHWISICPPFLFSESSFSQQLLLPGVKGPITFYYCTLIVPPFCFACPLWLCHYWEIEFSGKLPALMHSSASGMEALASLIVCLCLPHPVLLFHYAHILRPSLFHFIPWLSY